MIWDAPMTLLWIIRLGLVVSCRGSWISCASCFSCIKDNMVIYIKWQKRWVSSFCFLYLAGLWNLILYLLHNFLQVKLKNMLYHTARINCLAWSPDSCMVATGSLDTCILIYEVDKPASSRMTIKGAHLGGVYGLAFTDEQSVVSSGEDACVRVWRISPQWYRWMESIT